jgi:hypothetical protein
MATETKMTTEHEQIRRWVEERGGKPARVRGTGSDDDPGILRIDFPAAPARSRCRTPCFAPQALRRTASLLSEAGPGAMLALPAAVRRLPWVARERGVMLPEVEGALRLLERR